MPTPRSAHRHTIGAIELAAEFGAKTVSLQPGGPLIGTGISIAARRERFAEGLDTACCDGAEARRHAGRRARAGPADRNGEEYRQFKQLVFRRRAAGEDELRRRPPLLRRRRPGRGHPRSTRPDRSRASGRHRRQPRAPAPDARQGRDRLRQHLRLLDAIGYAGWVTVELYPFEATAAEVAKLAMQHLQKVLRAPTQRAKIVITLEQPMTTISGSTERITPEELLQMATTARWS